MCNFRDPISNPNNQLSNIAQYSHQAGYNLGRYAASSSNVITSNGLPSNTLMGNGQAVKPQFSHKQIIQSSQKPGYSMFAPNPTAVASFQRSNDGGSSSHIRNKQTLHSDRTISHDEVFKNPVKQMSPNLHGENNQYYQSNAPMQGFYAPMTSLPTVADPRTPMGGQSGLSPYQNTGPQDMSPMNGRSPASNAIYSRINNPGKAFHRSEQVIGQGQSNGSWTSQEQQGTPAYPYQQMPGSTPFVEMHGTQSRRTHFNGNQCIPIDEDGDNDDQELQKATDF